MYSERVLEHFHHPRNVGEIASPSAVAEVANPVCGDVMKIWVTVRDARIAEIKFKVQGCIPSVASGSWLTEAVEGRRLSELASLSHEAIEEGLGGLPDASRHASALAIAALRQALGKLQH
jgi:nitrogen fixation protein NifU and related proteins